jgi:hypothetical protein
LTAFVDPAGFGHGALAVALVDVDPGRHDAVVKKLTEWPEVDVLPAVRES